MLKPIIALVGASVLVAGCSTDTPGTGATKGGLLGAGVGAAIGAATGTAATGALIGGAVGAGAGAATTPRH